MAMYIFVNLSGFFNPQPNMGKTFQYLRTHSVFYFDFIFTGNREKDTCSVRYTAMKDSGKALAQPAS